MIDLNRAQQIADRVVEQLRPFCARIEIAGSIRRQRPECGDVDIVMEARDRNALLARVTSRCKLQKSGEQYVEVLMPDGTQLDLWFSHVPQAARQRDLFGSTKPDNFGCLLLARTGSTGHNIALAERAKSLGMSWNPHWGIYQAGACIASATEQDIYRALGLPFIEPVHREFTTRAEQLRLINQEFWRE